MPLPTSRRIPAPLYRRSGIVQRQQDRRTLGAAAHGMQTKIALLAQIFAFGDAIANLHPPRRTAGRQRAAPAARPSSSAGALMVSRTQSMIVRRLSSSLRCASSRDGHST